jgi:hypothetical protein
MGSKRGKGFLVLVLALLLHAGCTSRGEHGLRQTKAVWHGFRRCTTGIEHLPYGWDVTSRHYRPNYDGTAAAWVYVTVCNAGGGFGTDTPVGYQVVLYDPSHPMLFSLGGDELQKYLDDNTALSVETTDIQSYPPMVTPSGKLTMEVHQGDRAAQNRDLEIMIQCTKPCDSTKVHAQRREWNGAKLYLFLWDGEPHEI